MTTTDIIKQILAENPDIAYFRLIEFGVQKDIRNDLAATWDEKDEKVFQSALALRADISAPFWSGIMLANMNNADWSKKCVTASLRHNRLHFLPDIAANDVHILDTKASDNSRTALNSSVVMKDGTTKHIPMLDFHIPYSKVNTDIVKTVCSNLTVPGYILSSGRSYHFIGKQLFDEGAMIDFLARALLFSPIVDEIWIAHQLQDKSCSLRIGLKNGVHPTLICQI